MFDLALVARDVARKLQGGLRGIWMNLGLLSQTSLARAVSKARAARVCFWLLGIPWSVMRIPIEAASRNIKQTLIWALFNEV